MHVLVDGEVMGPIMTEADIKALKWIAIILAFVLVGAGFLLAKVLA